MKPCAKSAIGNGQFRTTKIFPKANAEQSLWSLKRNELHFTKKFSIERNSFFAGLKDWIENNVTIVGGSDYVLPTATESVKGEIKVEHSLMMNGENNEVMNVALDTISSSVEGFMWIHDID